MSDVVLRLTPEEAQQLTADIAELVGRYHHSERDTGAAEGTEQVAVQYQVLPLLAVDRPR
jgi:hypothetical protein